MADSDPLNLVGRQMEDPGSLVAFEERGGREVAARILETVRLITPTVSLGLPPCNTGSNPLGDTKACGNSGMTPTTSFWAGTVKLRRRLADNADECQNTELSWTTVSTRDHQPGRLSLLPFLS